MDVSRPGSHDGPAQAPPDIEEIARSMSQISIQDNPTPQSPQPQADTNQLKTTLVRLVADNSFKTPKFKLGMSPEVWLQQMYPEAGSSFADQNTYPRRFIIHIDMYDSLCLLPTTFMDHWNRFSRYFMATYKVRTSPIESVLKLTNLIPTDCASYADYVSKFCYV